MTSDQPAIVAEGLVKRYGSTVALNGLDLTVPAGVTYGVLGPNGAGKTTAVRVLTTLLRPDAGFARVMGMDVVRDARALRTRIGLSGQYAAVDELLTGRENLIMVGRLYHLSGAVAKRRADELLERFDLADAATRTAKTYSGGMRRRLDLAAALVVATPVIVLDEPTTGLDPRSRTAMWDVIGELVGSGATVLLTTQYLEEADRLAARIAVVDQGRVVAEGTTAELKAKIGGDRVEVVVADPAQLEAANRVLAHIGDAQPDTDAAALRVGVPVQDGAQALMDALRGMDEVGVRLDDVGLRRPTLDDVFMRLTGSRASTTDAAADAETVEVR